MAVHLSGLRVSTAVCRDASGNRSVSVSVEETEYPLPDRAVSAVPSASEPEEVPAAASAPAAGESASESPRQPAVDPYCLAFVPRLRGAGGAGELTSLERIHRAWRAGWLARRALDQQLAHLGERTPDCGLQNRAYILFDPAEGLAGGVPTARRFGTFRGLRAALGCEAAESNAVFHGFSSLAEAETYVLGAGAEWPTNAER